MIICNVDGSCRINPHGEIGYAYIINFESDEPIEYFNSEPSKYGNTSVVAEYKAFNALLEKLIELNLCKAEIEIRTDSMMLYRQFMGYMKARKGHYLPFSKEASRLMKRFFALNVIWVSRDENQDADDLAASYYRAEK
jgi:ribonuclease HI